MPEDRQALAVIVIPPFSATRENDAEICITSFTHILSKENFLIKLLKCAPRDAFKFQEKEIKINRIQASIYRKNVRESFHWKYFHPLVATPE